jgi:hypothetical protein
MQGQARVARKEGPDAVARRAAKKQAIDQKLFRISRIIEDAIGYSFPDGDPSDIIIPNLKRLGIENYNAIQWMDKAAIKYLNSKSYTDYLVGFWDDYASDNPDFADQHPYGNPWGETKSDVERRKHQILKGLLRVLRDQPPERAAKRVADLEKLGIDWPELAIIKKSAHADIKNQKPNLDETWPEIAVIEKSITHDVALNSERDDEIN